MRACIHGRLGKGSRSLAFRGEYKLKLYRVAAFSPPAAGFSNLTFASAIDRAIPKDLETDSRSCELPGPWFVRLCGLIVTPLEDEIRSSRIGEAEDWNMEEQGRGRSTPFVILSDVFSSCN